MEFGNSGCECSGKIRGSVRMIVRVKGKRKRRGE